MNEIEYYYRLKPIGIDNWDVKDVQKHNLRLNKFEDLSTQFDLMKNAYENLFNERIDIFVCILPQTKRNHAMADTYLESVVEICAGYRIKRKLFSKEIKECGLYVSAIVGTTTGIDTFDYTAINVEEVKQIFYDYIVNQKVPDFSSWKQTSF